MRRSTPLAALLALLAPCAPRASAQDAPPRAREVDRPANHLAGETSPYLLQHAHNPVDWYPWGPEALARAKEEGKPIFLSVGYSACHWCHVMERESFEDEEIAAFLNAHFVCVKVDREERPDVDELYMGAVQRMTGRGGWPLSVFLTPELEPFWGGTYWPPRASERGPGFLDVLRGVRELWSEDRARAVEAGRELVESLRAEHHAAGAGEAPGPRLLARAVELSARTYDERFGGFGQGGFAPKFPRCTQLALLLRRGAGGDERARDMALATLRHMAAGGLHDQLGGGFARYSVDRTWTVPHFERMLYDQAQLAQVYMEAWQASGEPWARAVSADVLRWVLREMTSPEGGFYSSTDADSEGGEGAYFLWTADEVRAACGDDAPVALAWFGVTEEGDLDGASVLTARNTLAAVAEETGRSREAVAAALERCGAALRAARERRAPPRTDDKVLAAWNGLMLSALARAAAVYGEEEWLAPARRNADFLLTSMRREDGGLWRTRRAGRSQVPGFLADHAFVTQGLLDLYEADPDPRWLAEALALHAYVEEHFADAERGGYWSQADAAAGALPVRTSSAEESSLPSDVGVASTNAARIGLLAGEPALLERARGSLARHGEALARWPTAYGQLLLLVDLLAGAPTEVYVAGPREDPRVRRELERLRRMWPPRRVFALVEPGAEERMTALLPAAEGKAMRGGAPTVYECREGVCDAPRVLE